MTANFLKDCLMQTGIVAIGTANPLFRRPQPQVMEFMANVLQLNATEKRLLRALYKGTQIEYRYSVLEDYCKNTGEFSFFSNDLNDDFPTTHKRMEAFKTLAPALAIAAINDCFTNLQNFDKTSITHLITVSCTGMYAPGIDIEIINQLQLKTSTHRTSINFMGCYAAFIAIKTADSICKSEPNAKVLIVCVELCTLHFQKNKSLDSLTANALFGDGAAALLIEAQPQKNKYLSIEAFYADLIPQSDTAMAWNITDSGFDMVLTSFIPELIEKGIPKFIDKLVSQKNLQLQDIDFFAIHTGGVKILQACAQALKITEDDNKYSYEVLREYGNMSSPTVLFVIKKIWDQLNSQHHNKTIFSCSFGPGLSFESMLLGTHYVC
jgi:alpha-pyrone synthase